MGRSEVSTSEVKWREGLSNRMSIIIIIIIIIIIFIRRNIRRSYEVCCLYGCFVYNIFSYSFGSSLYRCIFGCMFCMLLFNFVNYVFFLLCYAFL